MRRAPYITRGLVGSMLPTLYNFGNQILQAPGYVIIRNEMIHETRVIPTDGRPHLGPDLKTCMGDSRGHWEGNTLVVETTNFNDKTGAGGGYFNDAAKLTERFTRTGPEDLSYDLTINDPKTWTRPWTTGARDLEKQGKTTKVDRSTAGNPGPSPAAQQ